MMDDPNEEEARAWNEVWTAHDVSRWLGYHIKTVQRMAKEGKIPAKRVGGEWRFLRRELLRWMREVGR